MRLLVGFSATLLAVHGFKIETSPVRLNDDFQDCVAKQCKGQIDVCLENDSCKKVLLNCNDQCHEKESDCWPACLLPTQNKLAFNIVVCGHDKCYKKSQEDLVERIKEEVSQDKHLQVLRDQKCMFDQCQKELTDCFDDKYCRSTLDTCMNATCRDASDDKYQGCINSCLQKAGNEHARSVAVCVIHNCPSKETQLMVQDPEQCVKEHCPNEYEKCDQACGEVFKNCENKCHKNPLCWDPCINNSGNDNAKALYACVKRYHCY